MELILQGSQINLATRFKAPTPSVKYPPSQPRPGSASRCLSSLSSSNSSRGQQQQIVFSRRRPMSADNDQQHHHNDTNGGNYSRSKHLNNSSEYSDVCGSGTLSRTAKNNASSSNILNLLLTEPIRRSWTTVGDSKTILTNKNNLSLGQRIKSKANPQMNFTDNEESSVEEDVQAFSSGDEEKPSSSNHRSEGSSKNSKNHRDSTNPCLYEEAGSGRFVKTDHDNSKKYVTFSKSTEFEAPRLSSRNDRSNSLSISNNLKPDLPGRVSFSKNDVFDYSDCEHSNEHTSANTDTLDDEARLKIIYQFHNGNKDSHKNSQADTAETNGNDSSENQIGTSAFCCSMKCNSSGCALTMSMSSEENIRDLSKTEPESYNARKFQSNDESDKIIEDYKREIEQLNRQHHKDYNQASLDKTGDSTAFNPEHMKYFDNNTEHNKSQSRGNSAKTDNSGSNASTAPLLLVPICEDSQKVEESRNEISSKETNGIKSWNNNDLSYKSPSDDKQLNKPMQYNQKPQIPEHQQVRRDSATVVIQNYLKATNQDKTTTVKLSSKCNLTKPSASKKLSNETNRPRSSDKTPTPKPTSTKGRIPSKSASNIREDNRLNEFHMEKVESWMSIHEFDKSDKDSRTSPENIHNEPYNQTWRETPSSKTDDEGNYSFEDQLDGESTYDEIVSVIKEIDDQKHLDMAIMDEYGIDELELQMIGTSKTSGKQMTEAHVSPDRMREILSYLDTVDSNCTKVINESYSGHIPDSFRSEIEFTVEPDIIGDMPKISDLILLPNQQLARRVVALSMRANELSNAIQLSKEHMANVRTDKIKCVRAEKLNAQSRMVEQKKNFESIVLRHQGFIEQLLKDKAELCDKVAALSRRIDSQNQAWEHKLETEVVRVKEATMAGEKIRRERWVRENTKKIKELTVKGLEVEINKMTCTHQKEITELKRQHHQDLLDAVEAARRQHESLEMGIRDSYAQDREVSIEKERNAIRERFERQMEADQKSFEEQKSRLLADFAIEKSRLQSEIKQKELEYERRKDELVGDKDDVIHHMKRDFKERLSQIENKNQASIQSMRDQYEADFAIWKREHESALKIREVERENSIRNQCRVERDRQIDAIVAKVDAEVLKNQHDFDSKITRLKDKYENEMSEIERNEHSTREKYVEVRAKLTESEANRQNIESTAKQLEIQLQHTQKMYDNFIKDKENLKETARKEIQLEVATVKKDRDVEIDKIYKRVQQAIEKKDAAIELLHKDNAALKERCIKLEALIRQQRKDYFIK